MAIDPAPDLTASEILSLREDANQSAEEADEILDSIDDTGN